MLAEPGGASLEREARLGEPNRRPQTRYSVGLDTHRAMNELGIGEDLGDAVDRPGRHTRLAQRTEQLVALTSSDRLGQRWHDRRAVPHPPGIGAEAFVLGQPLQSEHGAQSGELPVVADRDDKVPVTGREALVGDDVRVGVAESPLAR